ncbi:MAG: histidinol-phosphate aminotransferase family protein [Proteobacteria bacterium]|nr:histidinol-phosphate aminotransferase family protein [Pseudomonadota bacterium]
MSVNRRELLTASALLLGGPALSMRLAAAPATAAVVATSPAVLCWNENPYGPSPAARAAVARSVADGCRYPPMPEIEALEDAIARHEGVGREQIVIGTGSGELLCALGLLYGLNGGEFVAAEPTYLELPEYAKARGATTRFVPVDADLKHDLPAMRARVDEHTRAVYLCNPNNPTGTAVPKQAISGFVRGLPPNVVAIVDEAYMDFVTDPAVGSVSNLIAEGQPVIVLRTFSKIHGMAGLRLGYAVASPERARALREARMTFPNILAVRAARASLDDHEFLTRTRTRILASRTRITTELARLNRRYAQPQGNFVFFDTGMPLKDFSDRMKARNVLVGRLFPPYETWCRITIGTEPEVTRFIRALNETLNA